MYIHFWQRVQGAVKYRTVRNMDLEYVCTVSKHSALNSTGSGIPGTVVIDVHCHSNI